MSGHGMVTRLKKTNKPSKKQPEETPIEARESVRLTEDLLYLVNKKLAEEQKESRNRLLGCLQHGKTEHKCFREVTFRKTNVQLSETG